MFGRRIPPYGTPRKVRVWDWLFLGGLGSMLLSFVVFSGSRGEFNYRRRLEPITAVENPLFFWSYLLFLLAGALIFLYVAFSEFKAWRRQQK